MTSIVYLLRDTKEIYGLYPTLNHAYNSLLQFIYTRYKYHNLESIASCNIDIMVSSFQIIEYDVNLVSNTYTLSGDFYLYDSKRKIYTSDKISISDFIAKLNSLKLEEEYTCDDLKIFLPIDDTEVRVTNNRESELKLKLKMLDEARQTETLKLEAIKQEMKPLIEQEAIKQPIINTEVRRQMEDKKLHEEKYRKFLVDRNVFEIMEREMNNGKREQDKVPELFQRTYVAFKKMRENNIFANTDDEQFQYFLDNIEKIDYFSGKYNIIFDAPNFEDLKKTNYIIESDDESLEPDSDLESESESNSDVGSGDSDSDGDSESNSNSNDSNNTDNIYFNSDTLQNTKNEHNVIITGHNNEEMLTTILSTRRIYDEEIDDIDIMSETSDEEMPNHNLLEMMDNMSRSFNQTF